MRAADIAGFVAARLPQYADSVFYSQVPPDPDECLVIFTYPGTPDLDVIGFDERAFQVRTRATTYDDAERMAEEAYKALHGVQDAQIGGWTARYILASSMPQWIGMDGNRRHEFTVNFRAKAHKT
jgi:hypothetical protein